jgi:hypothetical protein
MATLEDAVNAKLLEPYELPDWETRLPIRSLWVAFELWDWIDGKDELQDKTQGVGGRTLFEHLEQLFCDFRCSNPFPAGDLRQMMPTTKGIRTLRPAKLRIYGWCPKPHAFVAVTGAFEADTKKPPKKLNDTKRDEVLAFIKAHKLEHLVLKGDILAVFPPNHQP